GLLDGFRTHVTLVPGDRLGIVLLNNLHGTGMNLALSNTLLDHLLGLPRKDWHGLLRAVAKDEEKEAAERVRQHEAARQPGTRPSREAAAYAGRYEHPAYGTATVSVENGGLVWSWSSFHGPLRHWHYDTFTVADDWLGEV